LLGLAGKVDGGIYAAATWVAVADAIVTPRLAELFAATTGARDAVIGIIRDRVKRRRAIAGWEVDKAAGESLLIAGVGDLILHRTGHSLDVDLFGSGTDLDDLGSTTALAGRRHRLHDRPRRLQPRRARPAHGGLGVSRQGRPGGHDAGADDARAAGRAVGDGDGDGRSHLNPVTLRGRPGLMRPRRTTTAERWRPTAS
jgi:hypothetical protein